MPIDRSLLEPAEKLRQQVDQGKQFHGVDTDLYAKAREQTKSIRSDLTARRTYFREKYANTLTAPLHRERISSQREAIKEVIDPEDRKLLLEDVAIMAQLKSAGMRKKRSESGYGGRFIQDFQKTAGAYVDAGSKMIEAQRDLQELSQGKQRSPDEVSFLRGLERANQEINPNLSQIDDPSVAWAQAGATGFAGMAPDAAASMLALIKGGPMAATAYWTARNLAEKREDFVELGLDPGLAATGAGAVSALAEGAIEQLIPDPTGVVKRSGLLRPLIKGVGRQVTKASGVKGALAKRVAKRGAETAVRTLGELAEEGGQAASDEAMKFIAGEVSEDVQRRDPMDILRSAREGIKEAALPVALFGLAGGGGQVSADIQRTRALTKGSAKARAESAIMKAANEGVTPSRKQWRTWGLPSQRGGMSRTDRATGIKEFGAQLQVRNQVETLTSGRTPTAEQWNEWGFPAEEGKTPEARKKFLFGRYDEALAEEESEISARASTEAIEAAEADRAVAELIEAPVAQEGTLRPTEQALVAPEVEVLAAEVQQAPLISTTEVPESPAEAAQAAAEAAKPVVESEGFVGGGMSLGERIRGDEIPEQIKVSDPEVERRFQSRKGFKPGKTADKIKGFLTTVKNVATRAQEHIPNTPRFDIAREGLRLLKTVPESSQDEAIRTVAAIIDPLGPKQLELFTRHLIMRNLLASIKAKQPLRFGFESKEAAQEYADQLQRIVDVTPEVARAVEIRNEIVNEKVKELVELNLLPESAKESSDTYYHQQVLNYVEVNRKRSSAKGVGKERKTFQKKRHVGAESLGEEFDYNTSYIEAEAAWMRDASASIAKEEIFNKMMEKFDIKKELKTEAKSAVPEGDWRALAAKKKGYEIFQPEPGNVFYQAVTIPERVVEKIQQNALEELDLTEDDLRQVLAIGQPHRQFVIPSEMAAEFRKMKEGVHVGDIAKVSEGGIRAWKVWTLLNPKRAIGYNLRNMTGDLDAAIAGGPELRSHVPQAMSELRKYHGTTLKLSADLRSARDHGVVSAGFISAEIPDIKDLAIFRRFFDESSGLSPLARPAKAYFDTVKKYSEFRENTLRYAAFLSAKKQLQAGTVKHYGGSKKGVVKQIHKDLGVDAAAAHMSRNLLGDYGNMTVMGDWLRRRLMPFWAFQEINIKRTPRIVMNGIEAGQSIKAAGSLTKAAASAVIASRIAWMYGAMWAWNNVGYPLFYGHDDEDDLAPYERANPHILFGRNADESVRVFRNAGALGDFLEWGGINEAASLLSKYRAGQIDAKEIALEIVKAPIEKAFGSLGPHFTGTFEVATGQSLFPEPFQPRAVRRGEAAANIFGLSDEYKAIRGMTLGDGGSARRHYFQRILFGVVDARQTALSEMYDLRERFLRKKGVMSSRTLQVSIYKEARDAAKNENYDAFVDWKESFVEKFGEKASRKRFVSFLKRVDPIASRLSERDELEFEHKFLTSEQRGQLNVSRQYAGELKDLMHTWWVAHDKVRSGDAEKAGK